MKTVSTQKITMVKKGNMLLPANVLTNHHMIVDSRLPMFPGNRSLREGHYRKLGRATLFTLGLKYFFLSPETFVTHVFREILRGPLWQFFKRLPLYL